MSAQVRNSNELGTILNRIARYLLQDQDLCRYLYYVDEEPLSDEKADLEGSDLLHKNLLVVPLINEKDFNTATKVALLVNDGVPISENDEFKEISLSILIYTPFKSWTINSLQLRPFAIMSRIETLLKGKRIEGLGKIQYNGFHLAAVDDNMSCYRMEFTNNVFN